MQSSAADPEKIEIPVKQGAVEWLAVYLALTAGYVDVVGLIEWKTYLSFMSGNTTQLGLNIFKGNTGVAIVLAAAIGGFVTGIFCGTCFAQGRPKHSETTRVWVVAGLLMLHIFISHFFIIPALVPVLMLSFSMGVTNTIVTVVGKLPVNTSFVTGTLNALAKQLAAFVVAKNSPDKIEHRTNAFRLAMIWFGFTSGAIFGATGTTHLHHWALAVPVLLLLITPLVWAGYFNSSKVTA